MWDLNDAKYNAIPYISREFLQSKITDYDIYCYYIGHKITIGRAMNSPLRTDTIPSFSITNKYGWLMWKDFATGENGNAVTFVMKLKGIKWYEAAYLIACDFNVIDDVYKVSNKVSTVVTKKQAVLPKRSVTMGVKKRKWRGYDAEYWKPYGIRKPTLNKFHVIPISHMFFNQHCIRADKFAYAYLEFKDNKITYEILQPYNETHKWIKSANHSIHQGYTQLPDTGELLIITKSRKDVMALHDVCGVPAIGLQNEGVMMKDSVMEEYKHRFDKVVALFDNDLPGRTFSKKFAEIFNSYILHN